MGNLFARGATPKEIEDMAFNQIRYWNRWAELINKRDEEAARKLGGR